MIVSVCGVHTDESERLLRAVHGGDDVEDSTEQDCDRVPDQLAWSQLRGFAQSSADRGTSQGTDDVLQWRLVASAFTVDCRPGALWTMFWFQIWHRLISSRLHLFGLTSFLGTNLIHGKMRDFTVEFLKCVKFHGQFKEGVTEIHAARYQWIFLKHTCFLPKSRSFGLLQDCQNGRVRVRIRDRFAKSAQKLLIKLWNLHKWK